MASESWTDAVVISKKAGNDNIAQTFTVTELSGHQSIELIPASEGLHVTITLILANKVIEAIPIRERSEWSKDKLVLELYTAIDFGCKGTKSSLVSLWDN